MKGEKYWFENKTLEEMEQYSYQEKRIRRLEKIEWTKGQLFKLFIIALGVFVAIKEKPDVFINAHFTIHILFIVWIVAMVTSLKNTLKIRKKAFKELSNIDYMEEMRQRENQKEGAF